MNLELGDLVVVTQLVLSNSVNLYKKIGKVKHFLEGKVAGIGVEFTEPIDGHDLHGHCLAPYGWYMHQRHIQKLEPLSKLLRKQRGKEDVIHLGYSAPDLTIIIEE